jgi:hypothetical protein
VYLPNSALIYCCTPEFGQRSHLLGSKILSTVSIPSLRDPRVVLPFEDLSHSGRALPPRRPRMPKTAA